RAQLTGWRFIYLKDVVVPAELPPDMDGFKSQQHRWTKGSIQVCKKVLGNVWRSDVPLALKVEATAHLTSNFAYLLTLCTLVLMYPANFIIESSWQKAVFVDIPVFLFASLSVISFYLVAQGAQSRWGWLKAIPYLPLLLALGIGMSINNGKAVIEALLNKQSDFVRTPKYGVENRGDARKQRAIYKAGKSLCLWIETGITIYFGFLIGLAISRGQWGSLPFLMLFFSGFAYVSAGSLLKRFTMGAGAPPEPPVTPDGVVTV
ncbi:MAG: glycosyl transferase family 2, partial [Verrucomicrobiales bacterium]|nr:glycosyl transferase family 2 [Verrucomicrobiales bacterium]